MDIFPNFWYKAFDELFDSMEDIFDSIDKAFVEDPYYGDWGDVDSDGW